MHKRDQTLKSWTKPEIRRIVSGSAEFGEEGTGDGSGSFS